MLCSFLFCTDVFKLVVNENVSLVISRQLLTDFCTHLPSLPDSTAKEIYHFTLEKIQPRVISFEEQVRGEQWEYCEAKHFTNIYVGGSYPCHFIVRLKILK